MLSKIVSQIATGNSITIILTKNENDVTCSFSDGNSAVSCTGIAEEIDAEIGTILGDLFSKPAKMHVAVSKEEEKETKEEKPKVEKAKKEKPKQPSINMEVPAEVQMEEVKEEKVDAETGEITEEEPAVAEKVAEPKQEEKPAEKVAEKPKFNLF